MSYRNKVFAVATWLCVSYGAQSFAGISISPFASISSNKGIKTDKSKDTETETIKERQTYGIAASISFFSLLKVQASVGQSQMITTEKTSKAVDDFDEIDYEKDANLDTSDPDNEVKTTEVLNQGRVGVMFDPGFWILVARAKAGVQASQRTVKLEQKDQPAQEIVPPITYKPYAGVGLGVKFTPRIFAIAEYSFLFYKFPETEPFMREVSISVGVSI